MIDQNVTIGSRTGHEELPIIWDDVYILDKSGVIRKFTMKFILL